MRVYVGQTRSRALIAELGALGFGECTQPMEMPPRRRPWFLDNAAFSAWRAGRAFDAEGFERALCSPVLDESPPDFVVCPDRVATGLESLAFSLRWRERSELLRPGLPWYLVTQDGMTEQAVAVAFARFEWRGVFVGGSLPWKIATGGSWVRFAHSRGRPCHVGRVGTAKRVGWALRIGADSIDSCLPLWSRENLGRFRMALEGRQGELF